MFFSYFSQSRKNDFFFTERVDPDIFGMNFDQSRRALKAKLLWRLESRLQWIIFPDPDLSFHLNSIGCIVDRIHRQRFLTSKIQIPKINLTHLVTILVRNAVIVVVCRIHDLNRLDSNRIGFD